jgi:hypothetical protein
MDAGVVDLADFGVSTRLFLAILESVSKEVNQQQNVSKAKAFLNVRKIALAPCTKTFSSCLLDPTLFFSLSFLSFCRLLLLVCWLLMGFTDFWMF